MSRLKWLYPGMLIKRWIFITSIGILLISMGFALFISEQVTASKTFASVIVIAGIMFVVTGVKRMVKSFITVFLPEREIGLVDKVFAKRILARGSRIVAIGGGHGLSTILHGLKEYTSNITAIVTVADDGGSSGRLREQFDVLPPGDIRNCLVALANEEALMGKLFQFRFNEGEGLKGHNFGNLFITAMSWVTGDFEKAVKESSKILSIRGSVIPATIDKVILIAEHKDGTVTEGESNIPKVVSPIKKIFIKPVDCTPTKETIDAIKRADAIIMGPGSLYTSIMPNLLIKGLAKEIAKSKAKKIYVCNAMTQYGETDSYKVSDHIKAIVEHAGEHIVDYVIVNNGKVPQELLEKYAAEKAYMVELDAEEIKKYECRIVRANLVSTTTEGNESYIRHNSDKLARVILDIISESY